MVNTKDVSIVTVQMLRNRLYMYVVHLFLNMKLYTKDMPL